MPDAFSEVIVPTTIATAQDVCGAMLGLSLCGGECHEESSAEDAFGGVTAIVGLTGAWVGFGCLQCSAQFARQAAAAMLGTDYDEVGEDVLDAVGELGNMIVGRLKSALEDVYGPIKLSIPTVIYGQHYRSRALGIRKWNVLSFTCAGEPLRIKIALIQAEPAPPGV